MNHAEFFLAIDQGGHASRAIVFDQRGNIISQAEQAIQTFTPQSDWVEHDAADMVEATRRAINDAVVQLGQDKDLLKAAGLATQRSSIACWNKVTGKPLSPILSWQDRRQSKWLDKLQQHNDLIHEKTGLFLSPHYGASKMRWCLDNLDEVKQAYQAKQLVIGPLASFLAYQLLIEQPLLADPANASRTLLWNINQQNWDEDLLQLFGIPKMILPTTAGSRSIFGHLDIKGLKLPLKVITGDQSAALFAWGTPEADTAYINIGTGAFVQRPLTSITHTDRLLTGIAYQDDESAYYTLEGTVNGAGRALQWYAELNNLDSLEQRVVNALESNVTPALFINSVSGLGSPDWIADLEPRFIGDHETNAQLLAIIESIAFLLQRNMDVMHKTTPKPEQIIISGGLSNLDGLCQRLADLSNCKVKRPAEHEATAKGLAYLIAAKPRHWPSFNQSKTFTPNANLALNQRFAEWSNKLAQIIARKA